MIRLFLTSLQKAFGGGYLIFSIPQYSSQQCNKPLILRCDFSTMEFFLWHFKYFYYDFNHTQIRHISFCFNTTCRACGNVYCSLIHNFISWSLESIVCTHFQIQFHDSFLCLEIFVLWFQWHIKASILSFEYSKFSIFTFEFFFKFNNWNSSKFSTSHFWINLCLI